MAVEGLTVCEVCCGFAGVGRGIVPAAFAQSFFCAFFELVGVCSEESVEYGAFSEDMHTPVLKGGTSPLLLFQKFSR